MVMYQQYNVRTGLRRAHIDEIDLKSRRRRNPQDQKDDWNRKRHTYTQEQVFRSHTWRQRLSCRVFARCFYQYTIEAQSCRVWSVEVKWSKRLEFCSIAKSLHKIQGPMLGVLQHPDLDNVISHTRKTHQHPNHLPASPSPISLITHPNQLTYTSTFISRHSSDWQIQPKRARRTEARLALPECQSQLDLCGISVLPTMMF
jgi:hypothetical protein